MWLPIHDGIKVNPNQFALIPVGSLISQRNLCKNGRWNVPIGGFLKESDLHVTMCSVHVIALDLPDIVCYTGGQFYEYGITLIPAWMNNYIHYKVWDEISFSIPKLQRCNRWSLGVDKLFHPTLFGACDHLFMLGCMLIHVSKIGHRALYLGDGF